MNQEILRFFIKKGFLLDDETLDFFGKLEDKDVAKKVIDRISRASGEKIITKSLMDKNLEEVKDVFSSLKDEKKKLVESFFVNLTLNVEIKKEKYIEKEEKKDKEEESGGEVRALNHLRVISPNIFPSKKVVVEDFVRHFRERYIEIKQILQDRSELQNLTSIDKISGQKQNCSVIAMISNKKVTKNKNLLFEIEDLTGKTLALVNQNKPELYKKAQDILLDDIVGLKCSGSGEMLFVNDIVYPDIMVQEKKRSEKEIYALFTSDLHIGSDHFLEDKFLKFIDWINGKMNHKQEVEKIKYLFFTGDNVDGVGIFPGQENLLSIKDIKEQYKKLAEYLGMIRKDIRIIMCPGQHDAVRVAEPQPAIDKYFAPDLYKLENLTLVTNPSQIVLQEGFNVLMYHGASFHGVINDTESLRIINAHDKPTLVIKELLKRRHLAPTHSLTTYIPEEKDPLFIRKVPDIVTTGDLHKPEVDIYNGVIMIANSCWQSITPFEEKVGNHPDPCKVHMLNLKTRDLKILDFN